ncbi:ATP-binding protein [Bradyrhizobium sp. 2TAF24]|uniref:ATP-binding protein n=1 Tax=Bradyrhizobium sp. 2TAF24 TaxID=3233011 RepID=UPI003F906D00
MSDRANAQSIATEVAWFDHALARRLQSHAEGTRCDVGELLHPAPELPAPGIAYGDLVRSVGLDPAERLVLVLALLPHIRPESLDPLLIRSEALQRRFTEFGGRTAPEHAGVIPTLQTALFLLAGDDLAARLHWLALFAPDRSLFTRHLLLPPPSSDEPALAAPLRLDPDALSRLLTGRARMPTFSSEFPAQQLTTPYEWADLVLDSTARSEVQDILAWQQHETALMRDWQLARRLKPGYRALFHGPPGTGKTLTASLIGKVTGRPVYRTDLSRVVSKWIGETEKNLASLFDRAEHGGMILFFDEADSLFGKRTETRTANDRAANQQIAYLLQRIEDFPGLVILASNLRSNLDEAFSRRFETIISFPLPNAEQRLRLWEDNFRDKPYPLASDVDLARLARDHELSGGSIVNVLRYACLRAVTRESQAITQADLVAGVRRELRKDGKFVG